MDLNILSTIELEKGRVLIVKAEIKGIVCLFVNVYAPNKGPDRVELFKKLQDTLRQQNDDICVIMGGDWNCTTNFL